MADLFTHRIISDGSQVQGIEVCLDLDFARRAREYNINNDQRAKFYQRAIEVVGPDYQGAINLQRANFFAFQKTDFKMPYAWSCLVHECRYPKSSNYGDSFTLAIVPIDWQEMDKPTFNRHVRYRSRGANSDNEDKVREILKLFEQAWLAGAIELLEK